MDPTVFDPLAFALLAVGAVLVFAVGFVSSRVGRGGAASAQFEAATLRAEALHCHLRALPSTAEAISARFEVTYARPGKRTLRWPRGTAVSIQSG